MFVGTAQTGGSTLYTIKWTGLEPKEDGWSPPSDTVQVHALWPWSILTSGPCRFSDTDQVRCTERGPKFYLFRGPNTSVENGEAEGLIKRRPVGLFDDFK